MRRTLIADRKNFRFVRNYDAWAIGTYEIRSNGKVGRFHVRRVVWGRLMAREEKRDNEVIRRAVILIRERK
jgi:hypothetical protein